MVDNRTRERHRVYNLRRYHERRAEAIVYLGGKCVRCESTEELHMDHIDPAQKTYDMGKGLNISLKAYWDEVEKCQLLCARCHRLKHQPPHGTISRYRDCRCDACKKAKRDWQREYMREYRLRKKLST